MKRLAATALTAAAMLAGMLALAAPANASAFGCQYIGGFGFSWKGFSLRAPQGYLCHKITGDKKVIREEWAGYVAHPSGYGLLTGKVCNWRIDFVYYRASDAKEYRRDRGPTHPECSRSISRKVTADKTLAHYGKACAQLYVSGTYRSRQCHDIIS